MYEQQPLITATTSRLCAFAILGKLNKERAVNGHVSIGHVGFVKCVDYYPGWFAELLMRQVHGTVSHSGGLSMHVPCAPREEKD